MKVKGRFIRISENKFDCPDCEKSVSCHIRCFVTACKSHFHSLKKLKHHFEELADTDEVHKKHSPFGEITISRINKTLETTIKKDETAKGITLLAMLNAQTDEDQFNVMFSASSSTGKSYIPNELAAYFPTSEVIRYSGASATSLYHEKGIEVIQIKKDEFVSVGKRRRELEQRVKRLEVKKERSQFEEGRLEEYQEKLDRLQSEVKILVDFEGKILIFQDQPNSQLLIKIRPFLSHDSKYLDSPITDATGHGGHRTKHVILKGYASVFFCTVAFSLDEQEANRVFVLSPETTFKKINEGLALLDEKLSDRQRFRMVLETNIDRRALMFRVELIRASGVRRVTAKKNAVLQPFKELHTTVGPRAFRDLGRLYSLVYGHALLNVFNRERISDTTIRASIIDIAEAIKLYKPVIEAIERNLSPELLDFLTEVVIPAYQKKNEKKEEREQLGLSYYALIRSYERKYGRSITYDKLKSWMKTLVISGAVIEDRDPSDRRTSLYSPR